LECAACGYIDVEWSEREQNYIKYGDENFITIDDRFIIKNINYDDVKCIVKLCACPKCYTVKLYS
jgi:hypothetical protein